MMQYTQSKKGGITMGKKWIILLVCIALIGGISSAFAADAERGKMLFEDPTLGGGTTGKSCATCHENGEGIGKDIFDRSKFSIMGMEEPSLADVVNICIENPLGGKAIDPKGKDMEDLLAYMMTFTK